MPQAHRDIIDTRVCGAQTDVKNQSTVYVNDYLWAVRGTGCYHAAHPAGALINTSGDSVWIEDEPVIVHGPDHARPDDYCGRGVGFLGIPVGATNGPGGGAAGGGSHCDPMTASGSPDVYAYGS